MRLPDAQADAVRRLTQELAGRSASVRLFGSRLDDGARGAMSSFSSKCRSR